jgi:hypothetical protein
VVAASLACRLSLAGGAYVCFAFLGRHRATRRGNSTSDFRWMSDIARPRCVVGCCVQSNRSRASMQIVVTLINVCSLPTLVERDGVISCRIRIPRLYLLKTPVCSSMRRYPPAHSLRGSALTAQITRRSRRPLDGSTGTGGNAVRIPMICDRCSPMRACGEKSRLDGNIF